MTELTVLIRALESAVERPIGSSSGDLKAALVEQARTLDRLFHHLGRQALAVGSPTAQIDVLKASLRAQAQCTATIKALDALEKRHELPRATTVMSMSDDELLTIAHAGEAL